MKYLRKFENLEEAEYIFRTETKWMGTEYEEPLYNFTEKDYLDYLRGGPTYREYEDKAIDYHGLSWELDKENDTLLTSTQWAGTEEEVDSEGLSEDDYVDLKDIAMMAQGIEFDIVENEDHPNYKIKQQAKKYNL